MSSSHEMSDTYSNVLQAWSKSPSRHLCIDGYIDVGQESSRNMKKKNRSTLYCTNYQKSTWVFVRHQDINLL